MHGRRHHAWRHRPNGGPSLETRAPAPSTYCCELWPFDGDAAVWNGWVSHGDDCTLMPVVEEQPPEPGPFAQPHQLLDASTNDEPRFATPTPWLFRLLN